MTNSEWTELNEWDETVGVWTLTKGVRLLATLHSNHERYPGKWYLEVKDMKIEKVLGWLGDLTLQEAQEKARAIAVKRLKDLVNDWLE